MQFRQPHASYLNTLHKPSMQLQSNGIMPLIILEHQCYDHTWYSLSGSPHWDSSMGYLKTL